VVIDPFLSFIGRASSQENPESKQIQRFRGSDIPNSHASWAKGHFSEQAVQRVVFVEQALGRRRGLRIARTGDASGLEHVVEVERSVSTCPEKASGASRYAATAAGRGVHNDRSAMEETSASGDFERELTKRIWTVDAFAEQVESDPAEALRSMGVEVPAGVKVRVLAQRRDTIYFTIPPARDPQSPPPPAVLNQMDLWSSKGLFI
jgi:hypothetical protein